MNDFTKHIIISVELFLTSIAFAWFSDQFLHLSNFWCVIIITCYTFVSRFVMLKVLKFNKRETKSENILVMSSTFPRWKDDSTPPFVFDLSKRLNKHAKVVVLTPHAKGSATHEVIDDLEIYRFKYPFEKFAKFGDSGIIPLLKENKLRWFCVPFFVLWEGWAMFRLISKYKISTIHAHWIVPQGFLAVLYKLCIDDIKVVVTSHGGDIFGFQKGLMKKIKTFVMKNCDILTVVSSAIKDEAIRCGYKGKIEVIPMGVDATLFNPNKRSATLKGSWCGPTSPMLLFIGRLVEKKGLIYLIEAMPKVIAKYPTAKLLVLGEGEEYDNILKRRNELELYDSVIFRGAIANKNSPPYYATADVFIAPSVIAKSGDREGLPVTCMEAMASEAVVITTKLPGMEDLIENNVNGFLVQPKDSYALAEQIIHVLRVPHLKIKGYARKTIEEKFDWDIIAKKYYEVLK